MASSTSEPRRRTSSLSESSARSKEARSDPWPWSWSTPPAAPSAGTGSSFIERLLPEPAGDVVLGELVLRPGEDLLGGRHLDQVAGSIGPHREEGGHVRDAGSLLHVVRHNHDGVVLLQLLHELLDAQRGQWVEGAARLVHEDH